MLQINTDGYNSKRYGKPYIANVRFDTPKGEYIWGDWVGQPGQEGVLTCNAKPGDVIMTGQKDFRNSRNSAPQYHIVSDDMTLECCTKAEAYNHWTTAKLDKDTPINPLLRFSTDELQAEIDRRVKEKAA